MQDKWPKQRNKRPEENTKNDKQIKTRAPKYHFAPQDDDVRLGQPTDTHRGNTLHPTQRALKSDVMIMITWSLCEMLDWNSKLSHGNQKAHYKFALRTRRHDQCRKSETAEQTTDYEMRCHWQHTKQWCNHDHDVRLECSLCGVQCVTSVSVGGVPWPYIIISSNFF